MSLGKIELPNRYEPLAALGEGGGGEVWAVRDRHTGARYAFKVLAVEASEREMAALVREAVALSGLEGLGVPRVMRFGRLPVSHRPYLVRELVEGKSLEEILNAREIDAVLDALARAADQLTVLHRAGLLHGDVKPANVIVEPTGRATLVDLGLAAPWREGGSIVEGLTPRYAAPELLEGKPLTVRAEVYALGVALSEALDTAPAGARTAALRQVAERATAVRASERYPSADEFSNALRLAAGFGPSDATPDAALLWPIVGIDATSGQLLDAARDLEPGATLRIEGPPGSGRSVLLRRLAWSLGVEGRALAWIDDTLVGTPAAAAGEIGEHSQFRGLSILVDDADLLDADGRARVDIALAGGGVAVLVGGETWKPATRVFGVPPLDARAAGDLLRRAIPSLGERMLERVVRATGARPGELRAMVRAIASEAVASPEDLERLVGASVTPEPLPETPLARGVYLLDRGRFNEARAQLDSVRQSEENRLALAVAQARLELGLGEAQLALDRLHTVEAAAEAAKESVLSRQWSLQLGRAHLGTGGFEHAHDLLAPLTATDDEVGIEAEAYEGLVQSFLGKSDEARETLERAVRRAASASARIHSVALTTQALGCQRDDRIDEAERAYEHAILAAERAGDAGALAVAQVNLAGLLKVRGEIARAVEHFEAAVDMGKRSGRRASTRQALLNLANLDLYLGRLARARASIDLLEQQRAQLPAVQRAQLLGLQAEFAARSGDPAHAAARYQACAAAFEALGRSIDAAEARLEGVLVSVGLPHADAAELGRQVELARRELGDTSAHRHRLSLAAARIAELVGDFEQARAEIDRALAAARDSGEREWVWRALDARAQWAEAAGQSVASRRDREEALAVLEEIGARLPRDLREVYWNDPRRRQLKDRVGASATAAPEYFVYAAPNIAEEPAPAAAPRRSGTTTSMSQLTTTPLEHRLARMLEINSEIVGLHDLPRLAARITDHAVDLLRAERGYVLLAQPDGSLSVHTSRSASGDEPHLDFSRSIAQTVIGTGEPVVSLSARDDARMKAYKSVHQMMLQSVACVPIRAPGGGAIGALYVETRLRPGSHFERELPTLAAFADQMAIALENARLISENRERAEALANANQELEAAHERLRELLGERTAKLNRVRRQLRDARDTLYGHFGYQGLVGTSAAMRKVYALIERVKDTDVPVLITGESGTGKEVVAKAVHAASSRSGRKLLGVNCGAIPENLLESELFGHVRGAFTGADRDRKGLFREADGGSLLLDEIGETPPKMQSSLLRVLQEKRVRSVGGTHEEPVDVRTIFATNRELGKLVEEGRFREDLYYRIHVVEIRLPPLRERLEDVPQLVDHFLGLFAARYKREKKTLSRDAMRRLMTFEWPGNVRQLEHVLLNAWVLSDEPELDAPDLDLPATDATRATPPFEHKGEPPAPAPAVPPARQRRVVSEHRIAERDRIIQALQACNWNRVKAAELSGIPRRTFYRRLREYGIQ